MRFDGRFLTAILLSTLGVALTYSYYRATAPINLDAGDIKAIALVGNFDGRHQSRRESSQFWAPVQHGDALYPGDTIRTGETGDLQIRFFGHHQTLDIEPDTTVVITNPGEAPTLELLQGHLSVASSSDPTDAAADQGPALQLKTETGVVAMTDKNAVVSKEGTNAVRLTAQASVTGPNTFGIEWKQPQGDIEGTLNPEAPKPLLFKWTQTSTDTDFRVAVEWGATRKKMDHHQFVETPGQISAVLPLGRSFWRWSVYKTGETKPLWSSPSARVVLKGLFPPALVSPANAAVLHLKALNDSIALAWTPSERFSEYHVEVADDALFKKVIFVQKLTRGEAEAPFKAPRAGLFYWRLAAQDSESNAPITSRARSFIVQTKDAEKTTLTWLMPADKPQYFLGEKASVELAWSASNTKAVQSYRVRVAASEDDFAEAAPQPSTEAKIHVGLGAAGTYIAQVEALNSDGEVIGQSEKIEVKTALLPLLRAPASIGGPHLKADARGQVRVQWQPVSGAKDYAVELTDPAGKTQTVKTATTSQLYNHLRPGTYKVRLATVDGHGRDGPQSEPTLIVVSNQSAVKTIHIKRMEVK